MEREQYNNIINDLNKKMVFLSGPRQVGKTYLTKQVLSSFKHTMYLNYDNMDDRTIIQQQSWPDDVELLVFDELHKMPLWKNYLKGLYDTKADSLKLLITGSARLEIFNHAGDSLAGRYYLHRLLPFTPSELYNLQAKVNLERLLSQGGFPEPYLASNEVDSKRWRLQYTESLLSTDVFELDKIQNLRAIRTLFEILRERVGSTVSYQSLSRDIGISPMTVKKYIEILEALYIIFRLTPYSKNISRSLLKEPKIYFFDNGLVKGQGAQLENLVALSLLKYAYYRVDYWAENYSLHYLRTKDGEEVDFGLALDGEMKFIFEVKSSHAEISKPLFEFHHKYSFPAIQLVKKLRNERNLDGIFVADLERYLSTLHGQLHQ